MSFNRPSFSEISERVLNDCLSRFQPLAGAPRYNLLTVLSEVSAGNYHLLYGDLHFLSKQIFPDTAEAEFLRAHWSDRVTPQYALQARGMVKFKGNSGVPIPSGLVVSHSNGQGYYLETAITVETNGEVLGPVVALNPGSGSNLLAQSPLKVSSYLPSGVDSACSVGPFGISGGVDAESDAAYLLRVLSYMRTGVRYGKPGDFVAWAMDSSTEVSRAWEIKNYSIFGALLIVVIGGNQASGVLEVGNLDLVRAYLHEKAPPVLFAVTTPASKPINPRIHLLPQQDSVANRELVRANLNSYLDTFARPQGSLSSSSLLSAFVDGSTITSAHVQLTVDPFVTTALEYPILGDIQWV